MGLRALGLATSVSQLGFGYWGDRHPRGWLIWAGPAVGLICLSVVGLAPNLASLSSLLIVEDSESPHSIPKPPPWQACGPARPEAGRCPSSRWGAIWGRRRDQFTAASSPPTSACALVWSLIWGSRSSSF